MQLVFANNASSTLASSIDSASTLITLAPGSGASFPTTDILGSYFKLTLVDAATKLVNEIVHVTNRSGDNLTVVRGQEGTTARTWAAGDIAAHYLTAGSMAAMLQTELSPIVEQTSNHVKFSSGLIMQWGMQVIPTGNGDLVTFPVPFAMQVFNLQATDYGPGTNCCAAVPNGTNLTNFKAYAKSLANNSHYSTNYSWFAIGI